MFGSKRSTTPTRHMCFISICLAEFRHDYKYFIDWKPILTPVWSITVPVLTVFMFTAQCMLNMHQLGIRVTLEDLSVWQDINFLHYVRSSFSSHTLVETADIL